MAIKLLGVILAVMAYSIPGQTKEINLSQISFLLGCWQSAHTSEVVEEKWTEAADNHYQGQGRTLVNGEVVFWEALDIVASNEQIVYQPSPMGKKSVSFTYEDRSIEGILKKAAFVNLNHDFPQQIIYSLDPKHPGSLNVELIGIDAKSKPSIVKYSLGKVSCED